MFFNGMLDFSIISFSSRDKPPNSLKATINRIIPNIIKKPSLYGEIVILRRITARIIVYIAEAAAILNKNLNGYLSLNIEKEK